MLETQRSNGTHHTARLQAVGAAAHRADGDARTLIGAGCLQQRPVNALLETIGEINFHNGRLNQHLPTRRTQYTPQEVIDFGMLALRGAHTDNARFRVRDDRGSLPKNAARSAQRIGRHSSSVGTGRGCPSVPGGSKRPREGVGHRSRDALASWWLREQTAALRNNLVGFAQQINQIVVECGPEPVVGGALDRRGRCIAPPRSAAPSRAGHIRGRDDAGLGIALDVGVINAIVREVRRVGLDRQVLSIHLVPQVDLARHPVKNFSQGLVTHVHGDRATDTGMNVHIQLGVTSQGKQQVLHIDVFHDHAVEFLAHARTRCRRQRGHIGEFRRFPQYGCTGQQMLF